MRLVVFSSVSGVDIKSSITKLRTHGASQKVIVVGPFKVEDACVTVAQPVLEDLHPKTQHTFAQFLTLPFRHICDSCARAFEATAAQACEEARSAQAEFAFVAFHPVLFHQSTTGFIEPYQGADLKAAIPDDVAVERVVSIHDDIFDMYRRLMGPKLLFDPVLTRESHRREPLQDFQELMLLLDWRDRELSAALSITEGLGSRHFLFHAKGRTQSLWEAVCGNKPAVYLSHPISQPRRDILGKSDPVKCKEPNEARGRALIKELVNLANLLAKFVPLVEPTAIDELRLDLDRLDELREDDLKERVLPPLTKRWSIAQDELLCGQLGDEDDDGLLQVPADTFESFRFSDETLGHLRSAAQLLHREIRRQINVRDHLLAEQAGLIVAFRPFSLPDSPAPTGGVQKEVDVLMKKKALGLPRCTPGILIIHPPGDERRRRENEFVKWWGPLAQKFLVEPVGEGAERLRQRCLNVLLGAADDIEDQEVVSLLTQAIAETEVRLCPLTDTSSMASHGIVREQEAQSQLAEEMVSKRSIFRSQLQEKAISLGKEAIKGKEPIKFVEAYVPADKFGILVQNIIEKGLIDG